MPEPASDAHAPHPLSSAGIKAENDRRRAEREAAEHAPHPSHDPIGSIFRYGMSLAYERIDCVEAGECVHEHLNGACPYSVGVTK